MTGVLGRIPLSLNQGNDLPHRNAVESQVAKKASLGQKRGRMNWIDMAA